MATKTVTTIPQTAAVDGVTLTTNTSGELTLKDNGIDAAKIQTDAITNAKILAGAVDSTKILSSYVADDTNILVSDDTLETKAGSPVATLKTMTMNIGSSGSVSVRFKYDGREQGHYAADNGLFQIYVNSVATGTLNNSSSQTFITYSEDIPVSNGDVVELKTGGQTNETSEVKNFRIYGTNTVSGTSEVDAVAS